MAPHDEHNPTTAMPDVNERDTLGTRAWPVFNGARLVGAMGVIGSVGVGYFVDPTFKRLFFAYLTSYAFFLSIALGALAFVLLQHLTRAGWSVNVRRVAECLAGTMPILAALSAPILLAALLNTGALYRWARPTADLDHVILAKHAWLNRWFFCGRILFYFAIWTGIALWYWRRSTEQDRSGDVELTNRMQHHSAPALLILALTITFASFDLLMSLDPHWYSTMFGFYYGTGALLAAFAAITLVIGMLQALGYLTRSVTVEHFHDLGKWLFAFVFFWGYIAFSQYMLMWYANIPEETVWYIRRGATTGHGFVGGWTWVSVALLFGQLFIPFAGLMSKHMKRNYRVLMSWAAWVLVFHWLDMFWLVMPEMDFDPATNIGRVHFGVVEILCFIGIGGVFLATFMKLLEKNALRPIKDPRLIESLAFQQPA
jgi:hypothetical protein